MFTEDDMPKESNSIVFVARKLNPPYYQFTSDSRSWWHVDRGNGVLMRHFIDVVQAVRFDKNWTNFYHLCRSGLSSKSSRIREDSFNDLWKLVCNATDEQKEIIWNDPLLRRDLKKIYIRFPWVYYRERDYPGPRSWVPNMVDYYFDEEDEGIL